MILIGAAILAIVLVQSYLVIQAAPAPPAAPPRRPPGPGRRVRGVSGATIPETNPGTPGETSAYASAAWETFAM